MTSTRIPGVLLLTGLLASAAAALGPPADGAAPDPGVTLRAKLALLSAGLGRDALAIDVDTLSGLVTMHGAVSTPGSRSLAETAVAALPGVSGVRNLLSVACGTLAVDEPVPVCDGVLATEVTEAMLAEPFTFGAVRVAESCNGVVTLEGAVPQANDELAALRAAQRVPGVRGVVDHLSVGAAAGASGAEPAGLVPQDDACSAARDAVVTHEVKQLLGPADLATSGVSVDTVDGVVTLFGRVPCEEARRSAVAAASAVHGVRDVRDDLGVGASEVVLAAPAAAEPGLADLVRQSLSEQRQHFTQQALDAICIDVSDGVVRLQGDVPSSPERLLAATIARTVEGVRGVRNELTVSAEEPPAHQVARR